MAALSFGSVRPSDSPSVLHDSSTFEQIPYIFFGF